MRRRAAHRGAVLLEAVIASVVLLGVALAALHLLAASERGLAQAQGWHRALERLEQALEVPGHGISAPLPSGSGWNAEAAALAGWPAPIGVEAWRLDAPVEAAPRGPPVGPGAHRVLLGADLARRLAALGVHDGPGGPEALGPGGLPMAAYMAGSRRDGEAPQGWRTLPLGVAFGVPLDRPNGDGSALDGPRVAVDPAAAARAAARYAAAVQVAGIAAPPSRGRPGTGRVRWQAGVITLDPGLSRDPAAVARLQDWLARVVADPPPEGHGRPPVCEAGSLHGVAAALVWRCLAAPPAGAASLPSAPRLPGATEAGLQPPPVPTPVLLLPRTGLPPAWAFCIDVPAGPAPAAADPPSPGWVAAWIGWPGARCPPGLRPLGPDG